MTISDSDMRLLLRRRGVQDPCTRCHGLGARCYSSGATWRGGAGTASHEYDVCDECWGSGDEHRHWTDLRSLEATEDERVTERAARLLEERMGAGFRVCAPALAELADELERMSRGRKPRPDWYYSTCELLAKTLRQFANH